MEDIDVPESHDALPGFAAPAQCRVVLGHDEQSGFLVRSWASGRMHHALLFDGPVGIGKASLAFQFARHVISNPDMRHAPLEFSDVDEPLLRQTAMGAHPQLLHLTRPLDAKTGKHKTQLTVDETHRIGRFLSYTVASGGWRVVIVDPVNDMNANAANALLKNLEEPTPRTLFILIAQSSGRLLPTIRSRCLQLRFSPLNEASMERVLDTFGVQEPNMRRSLLEKAGGSPRMAALLSEGGALEVVNTADRILSTPRFDAPAALKIGEALATREAEPLFFLLQDHLMSRISQHASNLAQSSSLESRKLADLYASLTERFAIVCGFNLDKRQYLMETLRDMHQNLGASGEA